MICKKCKGEVDKKAVVCVHCGCKIKKPIYKKWWFWVIIAALLIGFAGGGDKTDVGSPQTTETSVETGVEQSQIASEAETITYESVDLNAMLEDLKSNAMKAENTYKNKQIEFTAKIKNFDSNGSYISVEPTTADEWNFDTVQCYIKNEEQKSILMNKNTGDTVTIKGKVKSIGEVLGYSVDIAEIN